MTLVQTELIDNKMNYDVAVVGGGLAGLCLAIQIAKSGHSVILFEKETYPFHKVCGEYISMESWDFLTRLGIPLSDLPISRISKFQISSTSGKSLEHILPLGGFGVSRYLLDELLMQLAEKNGVTIKDDTKVDDIIFSGEKFILSAKKNSYTATVAAGTFGKRSNIDIKRKRNFILASRNKLNNYVGIKYHIRYLFPPDCIALHNFKNGYCGIVKIENDKYCLCYLTTADNLQKSNNSIAQMEKNILSINPHLKKIFEEAIMLYKEPLVISQISFEKKEQVLDHLLLVGDASGMITPLCGNGMSMAMHGSKLAHENIDRFLNGQISRTEMENEYQQAWQKNFSKRLSSGRRIQRLFGNPFLTNLLLMMLKPFPRLMDGLIRKTHGERF